MKHDKPKKQAIWRIVLSTFAAAFGVQNNRNREQDFSQGNVYAYIVAGVLFTVFFIAAIILIVNLVLQMSA